MAKFEVVEKYKDLEINLPVRATEKSAGYDFEVASNIVVPPFHHLQKKLVKEYGYTIYTLDEMKEMTSIYNTKPTLVPTGIKCQMADDEYLEISVRSSLPLKHLLTLSNNVGIIDSDYYNNPDNEGEIFFQLINLSPFPILLNKGDKIGQGIIKKYIITEDDAATGKREGGFGSTSRGMRRESGAIDEWLVGADLNHV